MKFKHINVHNVADLVPPWALDPYVLARHLDGMFDTEEGRRFVPDDHRIYEALPFWIEVNAKVTPSTVRFCIPDDDTNLNGWLIIQSRAQIGQWAQIELPLNAIFKGYEAIKGRHSIYMHAFQTDVPLGYVGLTKQRWFERLSQHLSAARVGSPYLFHHAIREHHEVGVLHKVFFNDLEEEAALQLEEEFVGMFSLYPLGLNMIPGGKAGFAYLAKLGRHARNAQERDQILERLASQSELEGRPNPLCAARWAADPDFAARVICGHSGRLTVEQVLKIREGASAGKNMIQILAEVKARSIRQVKLVLSGKTYARIISGG